MIKLSPKTRRYLQQILPFSLIWLVFALLYSLLEKGILGDSTVYPSTGNPYNFQVNIIITTLTATILGLLVGAFEISYLRKLFLQHSFSKTLIYKTSIYVTILIGFLLLNTLISNALRLDTFIFDPIVLNNAWVFLTNFAFWTVALYIAVIIFITLFYSEVSDSLGDAVISNFFTGKYHHPVEENRIFMFVDMKSSTTIAEQLGHVKYFELLKTYYADLSESIIQYGGEVYQYVGDEIIISWELEEGLDQNNCLNCFFAMQSALLQEATKYQQNYGLVPSFKAGIHHGEVTTGEVGVIKTHLMFSGDVLNTTARIQGLCNKYGVDLLFSLDLKDKLNTPENFSFKNLGKAELRGRGEQVDLYTVV